MKKTICAVVALFFAVFALSSCGSGLSEDEVKSIAGDLIEKSYRVNDIFFGEGLDHVKNEESGIESDPEADKDTGEDFVYDVKPVSYSKVTTSEFTNTDQLQEIALEVYTEDYCKDLFKTAFEGIEDSDGNIYEYARYIMDLEYDLCVRSDLSEQSLVVGRTYDISTLKIEKESKGYVLFTVSSIVDGKDGGDVKLCIKNGDAGWRLDTPTY